MKNLNCIKFKLLIYQHFKGQRIYKYKVQKYLMIKKKLKKFTIVLLNVLEQP